MSRICSLYQVSNSHWTTVQQKCFVTSTSYETFWFPLKYRKKVQACICSAWNWRRRMAFVAFSPNTFAVFTRYSSSAHAKKKTLQIHRKREKRERSNALSVTYILKSMIMNEYSRGWMRTNTNGSWMNLIKMKNCGRLWVFWVISIFEVEKNTKLLFQQKNTNRFLFCYDIIGQLQKNI